MQHRVVEGDGEDKQQAHGILTAALEVVCGNMLHIGSHFIFCFVHLELGQHFDGHINILLYLSVASIH